MIRADLHIHTYYSDGAQSPADVVAAAKLSGLGLIAVTDHDNSCAYAEVSRLARAANISCVTGEEFSAYSGNVKVHVLGYCFDRSDPAFISFEKRLYDGAEERALDIVSKLNAAGVKVSYGDVLRERKFKKSPLHAVHIATACARKGYANSPWAFYAKYLAFGGAGFSAVGRPTPGETVSIVTACGGFCSLAHPGRITMEKDELLALVTSLKGCGLRGIEAVYSGHTAIETQYYGEVADKFGLLVTGGSDTHHAGGNRRVGEPEFYPDERLLSALEIS